MHCMDTPFVAGEEKLLEGPPPGFTRPAYLIDMAKQGRIDQLNAFDVAGADNPQNVPRMTPNSSQMTPKRPESTLKRGEGY